VHKEPRELEAIAHGVHVGVRDLFVSNGELELKPLEHFNGKALARALPRCPTRRRRALGRDAAELADDARRDLRAQGLATGRARRARGRAARRSLVDPRALVRGRARRRAALLADREAEDDGAQGALAHAAVRRRRRHGARVARRGRDGRDRDGEPRAQRGRRPGREREGASRAADGTCASATSSSAWTTTSRERKAAVRWAAAAHEAGARSVRVVELEGAKRLRRRRARARAPRRSRVARRSCSSSASRRASTSRRAVVEQLLDKPTAFADETIDDARARDDHHAPAVVVPLSTSAHAVALDRIPVGRVGIIYGPPGQGKSTLLALLDGRRHPQGRARDHRERRRRARDDATAAHDRGGR
jgi:hypothetical protein